MGRLKCVFIKSLILAVTLLSLWLPASTKAQSTVELDHLSIEIWPEFDRPSTLVIYRGQLADTVSLPATLTFTLPEYLANLNAVASLNAENQLINNPYSLAPATKSMRLNFVIDSPSFQFEYYDNLILIKEDTQRTLTYQLETPYPIRTLTLEVQQPVEATNLQLSPTPNEVIRGADQLTYHIIQTQSINAGEKISLLGRYTKETSRLTAGTAIEAVSASNTIDILTAVRHWYVNFGIVLLVVLIVFGGISWQAKRKQAKLTRHDSKSASYCQQCGTTCRPQAIFCYHCGVLIRREK